MAHNLPDDIAARCVPGVGPVTIAPTAIGLVNHSYRVVRDDAAYSLRIAAADSAGLGVERRWECAVLARASAAGVAPTIRCCDPQQGVLVADWVAGRAWTPEESRSAGNIDAMARLLRRVHALEIPRPVRCMGPAEWIGHYRAMLDGIDAHPVHGSSALADAAAACLETLGRSRATARVLCHSDLHRQNVLVGRRVLLLDWEFAHVTEAVWDLAGWVANNDWTAADAERFLAYYHARPVSAAELEHLGLWVWLYDYVGLLWSQLYVGRRGAAAGGQVTARAQILRERLEARTGGRAGQLPAH